MKVELRYVPPTAEGEVEEEEEGTKILLPPLCVGLHWREGETPFLSLPFPSCVSRRRRRWKKTAPLISRMEQHSVTWKKRACSSLDCNQGESEWTEAHLHEEGPPALEKYFL